VVKLRTLGFSGERFPHQLVSVVQGRDLPVMISPYFVFFLLPLALIGDSHVMGWGSKAIEIRAVDNGQLDGVFMHKRTQKLRFLCERNDKVRGELLRNYVTFDKDA